MYWLLLNSCQNVWLYNFKLWLLSRSYEVNANILFAYFHQGDIAYVCAYLHSTILSHFLQDAVGRTLEEPIGLFKLPNDSPYQINLYII